MKCKRELGIFDPQDSSVSVHMRALDFMAGALAVVHHCCNHFRRRDPSYDVSWLSFPKYLVVLKTLRVVNHYVDCNSQPQD